MQAVLWLASAILIAALGLYALNRFNISVILILISLVGGVWSANRGRSLWNQANRADQGAKAEEVTAIELAGLLKENWSIRYGKRIQGIGDIDIICVSPRQKFFVIDVKSHRCRVGSGGKQLYKQYGKNCYPFEKGFLKQVKRQAVTISKMHHVSWVTPIISFSNASVNTPNIKSC